MSIPICYIRQFSFILNIENFNIQSSEEVN